MSEVRSRLLAAGVIVTVASVLMMGSARPAGAAAVPKALSRGSATWAGYAGAAPPDTTIKSANVTVTLPTASCAKSVGSPTLGKQAPGWHAGFWIGLDGWNWTPTPTNVTVQQAGVLVSCPTRRSAATFRLFYEMFPAGPVFLPDGVHSGEVLTVNVAVTGHRYTFEFLSAAGAVIAERSATCARHTTCGNSTAEVITEAPGGGPDAGHGLAGTGTVSYRNAAVSLSGQPYGFPLGLLPRLTKITMNPKGLLRIVRPGALTGKAGPANFSTYWR